MNVDKFNQGCYKLLCDRICRGDCCGCINVPLSLVAKHSSKIQVRLPSVEILNGNVIYDTPDHKCMFLHRDSGMCTIYEDRLDVCKEYGFSDRLPCSFIDSEGNVRSIKDRKKINKQISDNVIKHFKKHLESEQSITKRRMYTKVLQQIAGEKQNDKNI